MFVQQTKGLTRTLFSFIDVTLCLNEETDYCCKRYALEYVVSDQYLSRSQSRRQSSKSLEMLIDSIQRMGINCMLFPGI